MTKRDRTPRADGWHDPNPRDEQVQRYIAAVKSPTWRNRGPKGRLDSGDHRTYFVIVLDDVPAAAGAIINGEPAPEGTRLYGVPLAPPFHSKRQCRKAFVRIVQRHPGARRMRWTALGRQPYMPPTACRQ